MPPILAPVLALASLVFAPPQAQAPPRKAPRLVDATAYGLRPGGDPRANRVALRKALAAINSPPAPGYPGGKVVLPAGDIAFDRPILVSRQNTELIGLGRTATRISSSTGHDAIGLGLDPAPGVSGGGEGVRLALPNFVDAFGILDATAAPSRGKRWGLRTFGTTHVRQAGGPLDQGPAGDGYASASAITLDAMVDFSRAGDGEVTICGLQEHGQGRPFFLARSLGQLKFAVVSHDGRVGRGTQRFYSANPNAPLKGLARITLQVDLAARTFACWVDGKRQPMMLWQGPPMAPGDRLLANQHTPYGMGQFVDPFGGRGDLTFYGHKVTGSALYAVGGMADPQARVDGRRITDELRYFSAEPKLAGYLPLDDPPAEVIEDRVLAVVGIPGRRSAYWLDDAKHGEGFGSGGLQLRDLSVSSPGVAVVIGNNWQLKVSDCRISGGTRGIGSLAIGGTWPSSIVDCSISGGDTPIYLFRASNVAIERIALELHYRAALRLDVCSGTVRNVFSPHWGKPEFGLKFDSCTMSVEDVSLDSEGPGLGSQVADLYACAGSDQPAYSLRVRNLATSIGVGPDSAFLMLDGREGDAVRPQRIDLLGCPLYDVPRKAAVVVVGGDWRGTVTTDTPTTRSPALIGGGGKVVVDGDAAGAAPAPPPPVSTATKPKAKP